MPRGSAGWSDVELSEAFAHVAANLFTDCFNHYARTDLDVPGSCSAALSGGTEACGPRRRADGQE